MLLPPPCSSPGPARRPAPHLRLRRWRQDRGSKQTAPGPGPRRPQPTPHRGEAQTPRCPRQPEAWRTTPDARSQRRPRRTRTQRPRARCGPSWPHRDLAGAQSRAEPKQRAAGRGREGVGKANSSAAGAAGGGQERSGRADKAGLCSRRLQHFLEGASQLVCQPGPPGRFCPAPSPPSDKAPGATAQLFPAARLSSAQLSR